MASASSSNFYEQRPDLRSAGGGQAQSAGYTGHHPSSQHMNNDNSTTPATSASEHPTITGHHNPQDYPGHTMYRNQLQTRTTSTGGVISPFSTIATNDDEDELGPSNVVRPSNIPINGRDPLDDELRSPMEAFKEWSLVTLKVTRQKVNERLGKVPKTQDVQLEAEIDRCRDTQRKYGHLLRLSRELQNNYTHLISTQQQIYEAMNDLSVREVRPTDNEGSPGLGADFKMAADMLKHKIRAEEKMILALKFFSSNLDTFVTKTVQDTLETIRSYNEARLEMDAEKNLGSTDPGSLMSRAAAAVGAHSIPSSSHGDGGKKLRHATQRYMKLKSDVEVKLRFLEENKMKVIHKQLVLFHNSLNPLSCRNEKDLQSLDTTLRQFSLIPPNGPPGSLPSSSLGSPVAGKGPAQTMTTSLSGALSSLIPGSNST